MSWTVRAATAPASSGHVRGGWTPLLVLLGMLVVSMAAAVYVANATRTEDRLRFQKSSQNALRELRDAIVGRVDGSIDLLRSCSALFAVNEAATSAQFHTYLDRLDMPRNYPGVRAVGYIQRIAPDQVDALTRERRAAGDEQFHVWPARQGDGDHLSIVYLEPPTRSRTSLGFDMSTEPARLSAMLTARDSGAAASTGKVTLLRNPNDSAHIGLLTFLPVYRGGRTPDDVQERKRLLAGFVYGGFRADTLFEGVANREIDSILDFSIYDGTDLTPENLLYRTDESPADQKRVDIDLPPQRIELAGHPWTLACRAHLGFTPRSGVMAGLMVLAGGTLIAMSLCLLTLVQVRARAAAERGEAEQRRSEEALRQSERRLRRLVDSNIIGVVVADDSGKIIEANQAFLRLMNYDREGVDVGSAVWPPPAWRELLAPCDAQPRELELARPDGSTIPLLVGLASLGDGGGLQAGFILDLTDQKRGEAERARLLSAAESARADAEAANRSKDEFLATLSHELRTPLNAILGWAQLLRMGGMEPDETARGLETIERNAKVQAQLVEDLLDLSRIISGKLRLTLKPIDPAPVVEAALDSVGPAAAAKGITVLPVLDAHVGAVLGDADRLQQVVWNLLSNAIKFTPRGGRIELLLQKVGAEAHIAVTDSGQGIDAAFLPYVFDRLRQADGSTTRRHGGLGLGLAIVRHLVELHGGSVHASSRGTGLGSTFLVTLPLPVLSQSKDASTPASAGDAAPVSVLAGLNVLVVDDEPDARELVTRVLRRGGAQVVSVDSASAALEALQRNAPDVLISDISMPGEDGYSLLRRVRTGGQQTPAIALTAFARTEDREQAMAAGFVMHIAKPFDPTELVSAVVQVTRLHSAS